jgi:hypothetical protein
MVLIIITRKIICLVMDIIKYEMIKNLFMYNFLYDKI